jgi:hypothetical protein
VETNHNFPGEGVPLVGCGDGGAREWAAQACPRCCVLSTRTWGGAVTRGDAVVLRVRLRPREWRLPLYDFGMCFLLCFPREHSTSRIAKKAPTEGFLPHLVLMYEHLLYQQSSLVFFYFADRFHR